MSNSSNRIVNLSQSNDSNDSDQLPRVPTRDTLKDKLNQRIIDMLEIDGRKPFNEIAKSLEISEGTVRNRVNRMKDAGVLQIKALVDRSAINYATDSMLGIKVASTSSPTEVAKRLQDCNETLTKFLDEHCFNNDDIKDVEVMKGLATYKNQFLLKSHEKL